MRRNGKSMTRKMPPVMGWGARHGISGTERPVPAHVNTDRFAVVASFSLLLHVGLYGGFNNVGIVRRYFKVSGNVDFYAGLLAYDESRKLV